MFVVYALSSSLLFAFLWGEAVLARTAQPSFGMASAVLTFLMMFASFLAPRPFFRYTMNDVAPTVMTRVVTRSAVASGIVLLLAALTLLWFGSGVALISEIYLFTLMAILLFHGLGGAIADHVVYLQRTKQYNSNQLAAVLLLVTLLLFVLVLYFLAFDLGPAQTAHAVGRDLLAITTALVGYGWAIYQMAHH